MARRHFRHRLQSKDAVTCQALKNTVKKKSTATKEKNAVVSIGIKRDKSGSVCGTVKKLGGFFMPPFFFIENAPNAANREL